MAAFAPAAAAGKPSGARPSEWCEAWGDLDGKIEFDAAQPFRKWRQHQSFFAGPHSLSQTSAPTSQSCGAVEVVASDGARVFSVLDVASTPCDPAASTPDDPGIMRTDGDDISMDGRISAHPMPTCLQHHTFFAS